MKIKFKILLLFVIMFVFTNEYSLSEAENSVKLKTQEIDLSNFLIWKAKHWSEYSGMYEFEFGDSSALVILIPYTIKINDIDEVYFSAILIGPNQMLEKPSHIVFEKLKLIEENKSNALHSETNTEVFQFLILDREEDKHQYIKYKDLIFTKIN